MLTLAATLTLVMAEAWRRKGFDIGSRNSKASSTLTSRDKSDDVLSVSSASSMLKKENAELKRQLAKGQLPQLQPVPEGAPPLPPPAEPARNEILGALGDLL